MTEQELYRVTLYVDDWKMVFDDIEKEINEDATPDVKEFYNKVKNIYVNYYNYAVKDDLEYIQNRFMYFYISSMIPELSRNIHNPLIVLEKLQNICLWCSHSIDVRYHEYDTQTGKYVYSFVYRIVS